MAGSHPAPLAADHPCSSRLVVQADRPNHHSLRGSSGVKDPGSAHRHWRAPTGTRARSRPPSPRLRTAPSPRARMMCGSRSPTRAMAAAIASSESTMKPFSPSATTSGTDPLRRADHRGSAGHGLGHHEPERPRPLDREQQGGRPAQQVGLLLLIALTPDLDIVREQRLHFVGPVGLLALVLRPATRPPTQCRHTRSAGRGTGRSDHGNTHRRTSLLVKGVTGQGYPAGRRTTQPPGIRP